MVACAGVANRKPAPPARGPYRAPLYARHRNRPAGRLAVVPEGHTIRRLANDLQRDFGDTVVNAASPQGRFAEGAALLDGRRPTKFASRGKHLFGHWDDTILHVHLGLIGSFAASVDGADDTCRLRLEAGTARWDLRGPQTCAIIDPAQHDAIVAKLGPDPLGRSKDPSRLIERVHSTKRPVAAALLDQSIVAGIGNVYRCELCFLVGVDPQTPAAAVDAERLAEMWDRIRALMRLGVKTGRIITRDPDEVGGTRRLHYLDDDDRLYVYKREGAPCHRCGDEIRLIEIGGRDCRYCPTCQRR